MSLEFRVSPNKEEKQFIKIVGIAAQKSLPLREPLWLFNRCSRSGQKKEITTFHFWRPQSTSKDILVSQTNSSLGSHF